ncbi:transporter [Hyphomicrobium sp. 802]|uniref:SphA family protein n=1 Tax=Hyphomicrobium sp. 802 TaxID=1112272 RepID=UPI0018CC62F3|nr:transporter [Hyphomicrobium sp. 802]
MIIAADTSSARAVEGGQYGAPLGGTDIRQAYLPPTPGLYGGIVGIDIAAPTYAGDHGESTRRPAFLYSEIGGIGLMYVYPIKPFDFTIASSIQIQYAGSVQELTINGRHLKGFAADFGDSYSDLIYASRYLGLFGATPGNNPKYRYGLTAAFGVGAELPIGAYTKSDFVNIGKNTFIIAPNAALTYLTGPNLSFFDGTEISARFFYDTSWENSATHYSGGNLIDLDYSISQRWGNFQFGVAGVFAQQLTADYTTAGLVSPNGNKYTKIDLGPVFAWDSPELGTTFKLKALFPIEHANSYDVNTVVLSASKKLW